MNFKANLYLSISIAFLNVLSCKKNEDAGIAKKTAIDVKAVQVSLNDIKEYVTFNGITAYQRKENIRSHVTGYISSLPQEIGKTIGAGQVFAYVRTKEQDALREAADIDSSLIKFIKPITIKSNVSGIISSINVNRNDYVAEGDTIAVVVQPKSLVVKLSVPYEYKESVRVGAPCELLLPNGKKLNAKISKSLPLIDAQSQSQTFLIDLPEADLPENLILKVKLLERENEDVMSIPKMALQTNELLTEFWVMKVVNDSLAIRTMVQPILKNDSLIEIQSDSVHIHDWIITDGAYQMNDSTIVKIENR